jgi:putative PIN family toxin of toxin-antitoxin system
MIVVLDTNVVISALLAAEGKPAELVRLWENGEFDVAVSSALLDELSRALHYPKIAKRLEISDEEILSFLNAYLASATLVSPETRLNVIAEDTDDNQVLECAVAASAAVIVTGDGHLLALKSFQGIEILTPSEFTVYLQASR